MRASVREAMSTSTPKWLGLVRSGGKWDYKSNEDLQTAGLSPERLDEFGNVRFGSVARAHGWSLEASHFGGGTYRVFFQVRGNAIHWRAAMRFLSRTYGGYALPTFVGRGIVKLGFTWGDDPGDSMNIAERRHCG